MTDFELPDYDQISIEEKAPIEVLREAALELTSKTRGGVEGSIFTGSLGGVGSYRHTFYLRAPSLNDFTDPLFYVWHGAELYPAHIVMAGNEQKDAKSCQNENELHNEVQHILVSTSAQQRIRAMLAQIGRRSA